ncbi:MAG: DUF3943 domain-containing protein [Prolixibacteraceae bacterium]|jgi:hypothetical protein|nr:DUF3943 domain-containing protein [Prolixibacteraceae bacterium]
MHHRFLITLLLFFAVETQCKVFPRDLRSWELRESLCSKAKFQANLQDKSLIGYNSSDSVAGYYPMRNKHAKFGTKAWRGSLFVFGFEICSSAFLYVSPKSISNWDRSELTLKNCLNNFKRAYKDPPVLDNDLWIVNYVGHPYQGAYFYNAVRSQNASIVQSSLFCFGHSMFWEYFTEAFFEQPSIQDIIVTPITGIVFGELAHRATIRMSRNGFTWYEKGLIVLINPMYVLNNGFKYRSLKQKSVDW